MTISTEEILSLANLARIEITEEEAENLSKEIDPILGYIGEIKNLNEKAEVSTPKHRNVLREDIVTRAPDEYTDDLLNLSPSQEGRHLKVKKIL